MEIKITANIKKVSLQKIGSTLSRPKIPVKQYYPLLEPMFKQLQENKKEN